MVLRAFPNAGKTADSFVVVKFKYPTVDVIYEGEENYEKKTCFV